MYKCDWAGGVNNNLRCISVVRGGVNINLRCISVVGGGGGSTIILGI